MQQSICTDFTHSFRSVNRRITLAHHTHTNAIHFYHNGGNWKRLRLTKSKKRREKRENSSFFPFSTHYNLHSFIVKTDYFLGSTVCSLLLLLPMMVIQPKNLGIYRCKQSGMKAYKTQNKTNIHTSTELQIYKHHAYIKHGTIFTRTLQQTTKEKKSQWEMILGYDYVVVSSFDAFVCLCAWREET